MAKVSLQIHSDIEGPKNTIISEVKKRLARLRKRYDEILSATVNLDTAEKNATPYKLKATVILKTKLKNFVASKAEKNPLLAVRESFDATERQIRKYLDKLRRKKKRRIPSDKFVNYFVNKISHRWEKHKK